jgi:o-succinylbenzoate---CoA ligase
MYDWLERAARRRADAIAIEYGDQNLTYAELMTRARGRRDDVRAGERVVLPGDDAPAFAVDLHAVLMRGGVAMPLDPRLSREERDFRASVAFAPPPGTATMMFTSGTTSAPKPVYLTVSNWEANAIGSALALGLDLNERWLCTMPLAHVGGLSILLRSTVYATTVVLHSYRRCLRGYWMQAWRAHPRCAGFYSAAARSRQRCLPAPPRPASLSPGPTG